MERSSNIHVHSDSEHAEKMLSKLHLILAKFSLGYNKKVFVRLLMEASRETSIVIEQPTLFDIGSDGIIIYLGILAWVMQQFFCKFINSPFQISFLDTNIKHPFGKCQNFFTYSIMDPNIRTTK